MYKVLEENNLNEFLSNNNNLRRELEKIEKDADKIIKYQQNIDETKILGKG